MPCRSWVQVYPGSRDVGHARCESYVVKLNVWERADHLHRLKRATRSYRRGIISVPLFPRTCTPVPRVAYRSPLYLIPSCSVL